ncbi:MAG TPA: DUF1697 domain-containing protein, partial [Kofleriaceae bacterium]|nr:DUF1697 domain-containing protein [Kofleriaceae bacterium]
MNRYVILLRGINVGGNNIIKMSALKACLEQAGFVDVSTYIASGNVFVSSDEKAPAIVTRVEKLLAKTFAYDASVVVRSKAQMQATILKAPPGFGRQPAKFRYDCLFLKEPLTAAAALKSVTAKAGVDTVHAGPGALYFSRLVARITQTQLGKIVGTPIYKQMTIRNWNT